MLVLPDTITLAQAKDVLRMLEQARPRQAAGGDLLVVDASAVKRVDSSALAVLLEFARSARAWGQRVVVRGPPPDLVGLAKLYGVDSLLLDAPNASGR